LRHQLARQPGSARARIRRGMTADVVPEWSTCPALPMSGRHGAPVVLMVPTPETRLRTVARDLVRTALREFLAPLLDCTPAMVPLQTEPGNAPTLDLASHSVHLSISHEAGLSLAAIRTGGRVGVDLMRTTDAAMPDWKTMAHDYLGPDAAQRLQRIDVSQRQLAFAQAWTQHEACLKCMGLHLQEWSPGLAQRLTLCSVSALELPTGYIGATAIMAQEPARHISSAVNPGGYQAHYTERSSTAEPGFPGLA
jgi:4'-phosphopantetheinyl transferase